MGISDDIKCFPDVFKIDSYTHMLTWEKQNLAQEMTQDS